MSVNRFLVIKMPRVLIRMGPSLAPVTPGSKEMELSVKVYSCYKTPASCTIIYYDSPTFQISTNALLTPATRMPCVLTPKARTFVRARRASLEMESLIANVCISLLTVLCSYYHLFSTDIDHCSSTPCGANAKCVNTEESFTCTCLEGFSGDAYVHCASKLCVIPHQEKFPGNASS